MASAKLNYQLPSWPLIDFHAHFPVAGDDILGKVNQDYQERYGPEKLSRLKAYSLEMNRLWRKAWCFPEPEPVLEPAWEETARRWSRELAEYGIEKIVFVTGGGNQNLYRITKVDPGRFLGFAHHDPFMPGAADELKRSVREYGFRGYKILAPTLSGPLSDPALTRLWEVAEELGVPVIIHFGVLGGGGGIGWHENISPLALHNVAKGYPGIPFVIPHFGCGYPKELLHLAWVCPNIYVDTCGNNEWVRWMPYALTLEDLFRRFYETIGPERIIFGSDSEWFPRGFALRYLLDQLRTCYQLGLPETEMAMIFGGNAARLLKVDGKGEAIVPEA
ncbi:MAG: amidohydrolase family protein [Clostridia bacterium]|nr:amidohydrolase family protein [Clostridia bacterium]